MSASLLAHLKETGPVTAELIAFERGSLAALLDCRRRVREAQRRAQIELYGACPRCNTPYPNDTDPCIKCDADEPGELY